MDKETSAQIYLAGQRGHFQQDGFRSLRTLNFEDYQAEGRAPVGNLLALNDETLLAGKTHRLSSEETCRLILLPMVGGIEVSNGTDESFFVDSREFMVVSLDRESSYQISNPYAEEAVNYLQIRLKEKGSGNISSLAGHFDLRQKNILHPVYQDKSGVNVLVGKYDGRAEDSVHVPGSAAFAFIIEGAFEVQNRLLEKRNALSVWGAEEIDFEALSEEAVILVAFGI